MTRKAAILGATILLAGYSAIGNAQEDMTEVVFVPHFIRIHESGNFFAKTWHEMDSNEFSAGVGAICSLALDCGGADTAMLALVHNTQQITTGGDFSTSGVIHKHEGEDWKIAFPPPPGYTTCNAAHNPKTISANGGDHTSGGVFRGPKGDWVGTDNVVPLHRKEGHWVSVDFIVKYVKVGTEGRHNCVPDGTLIWNVSL